MIDFLAIVGLVSIATWLIIGIYLLTTWVIRFLKKQNKHKISELEHQMNQEYLILMIQSFFPDKLKPSLEEIEEIESTTVFTREHIFILLYIGKTLDQIKDVKKSRELYDEILKTGLTWN